jgi:hypothetical protein
MTPHVVLPQSNYPFNTPLESGLRTLTILAAVSPTGCDLQRLVYYDYLLVHSGDASSSSDAPVSIHPASPHRSGEVVVRRNLIEQGIRLMLSKELLLMEYGEAGIAYRASEITDAFLSYFETQYAVRLRDSARWVVSHFASYTDTQMDEYMTANIGRWGSEFVRESVLQGEADE